MVVETIPRIEETAAPASVDKEPAPELSIVMPCLNEADTLETCIEKAQRSLDELNIAGEIIVADNGSTDGSQVIGDAPPPQVPGKSLPYGNRETAVPQPMW